MTSASLTPTRRHARPAATVTTLTLLMLSACGTSRDVGTGRTATGAARADIAYSAASGATGATQANLERYVAVARHLYWNEMHGRRVHADLNFVMRDRRLLTLVARGELAGAAAEAHHLLVGFPIRHLTRIAIVKRGRVLVNAVWNKNGTFVAAPLQRRISLGGTYLGTLMVSVQDIVGLVKLIPRFTPAQTVVRGSSGQVRTSLPAAEHVSLPSSGEVTIAGRPYLVASFTSHCWGRGALTREPLTVWLLLAT